MAKKTLKETSISDNEYSITRVPEMRRAILDAWTYSNGDPKKQLFQTAVELTNGRCFYCGDKLAEVNDDDKINFFKSVQWDHLYPSSLGNPLVIGNCVLACVGCNGAKSDKLPIVYIEERLDQGLPLLFDIPEYVNLIDSYSKIYKENYPNFVRYSKLAEKGLIDERDYQNFWKRVLSETLLSDWRKQVNWNGKLWKRHADAELFENYVESFKVTDQERSKATLIVNTFAKTPRSMKELSDLEVVEVLDRIFYGFIDSQASLRRGLRQAIIRFVTMFGYRDFYIKNSKFDIIDKIEAHVNRDFFERLKADFIEDYISSEKEVAPSTLANLQQTFRQFTKFFEGSLDKTIYNYTDEEVLSLISSYQKIEGTNKQYLIVNFVKEISTNSDLNYKLVKSLIDVSASWVDDLLPRYAAFDNLVYTSSVINFSNVREFRLLFRKDPLLVTPHENLSVLKAYYENSTAEETKKLIIIREFAQRIGLDENRTLLSVNENLTRTWVDDTNLHEAEDNAIYEAFFEKYSKQSVDNLRVIFVLKTFVFTSTTGNTLKEVSNYQFKILKETVTKTQRPKIDFIMSLVNEAI